MPHELRSIVVPNNYVIVCVSCVLWAKLPIKHSIDKNLDFAHELVLPLFQSWRAPVRLLRLMGKTPHTHYIGKIQDVAHDVLDIVVSVSLYLLRPMSKLHREPMHYQTAEFAHDK